MLCASVASLSPSLLLRRPIAGKDHPHVASLPTGRSITVWAAGSLVLWLQRAAALGCRLCRGGYEPVRTRGRGPVAAIVIAETGDRHPPKWVIAMPETRDRDARDGRSPSTETSDRFRAKYAATPSTWIGAPSKTEPDTRILAAVGEEAARRHLGIAWPTSGPRRTMCGITRSVLRQPHCSSHQPMNTSTRCVCMRAKVDPLCF